MKKNLFFTMLAPLVLGACAAIGPRYTEPPAVEVPVSFRHGTSVWVPASTASTVGAVSQGRWWAVFDDPQLDALVQQVDVANNSLAQAIAANEQARALLREQSAGLFPTVSLDGGATVSRSGSGAVSGGRTGAAASSSTRRNVDFGVGASWEPDLWGRLARGVTAARAGAQASAADLAAARLSLQSQLATAYLQLRGVDAERSLQVTTVQGLQRALRITSNRYEAGVVARTDVLQAQTQLANAQADLLTLERQRAQLENAIAVLVGRAPSAFAVAPVAAFDLRVPDVPQVLPSTLLLRRPDILAAERRVAQANEQIGIAQSAWFPSLRLTGSAGTGGSAIADLFSASTLVWSLGASIAQTVFDAGAIAARVDRAGAAYESAVAGYRQTVLQSFQSVEDQLAASRVLADQLALRELAARSAALVEQQVFNRYEAGQVGFTDVINAQTTAQNARRSLVQLRRDRLVAAVSLIQAIGGSW